MNKKLILNKTLELLLFSFLFILPFSYGNVTIKWDILFIIIILLLTLISLYKTKIKQLNISAWQVIYAVLFMVIFSFTDKVNFIQLFNIPININNRIPLSTLILSLTVLIYLLKVSRVNKIYLPGHPFARYFFLTSLFIIVLILLLYPVIHIHYKIEANTTILLLNKIVKYALILVIISYYISDKNKWKRINIGLIFSLSITVILSIML